jgi:hypothetical protein
LEALFKKIAVSFREETGEIPVLTRNGKSFDNFLLQKVFYRKPDLPRSECLEERTLNSLKERMLVDL